MTFSLQHISGSQRLLLLFGGWSAEHTWFYDCVPPGYDLITVCDYTAPDSTAELLSHLLCYSEIGIVAWSFGVPQATRFIALHPELPFTTRIAVNGTLTPVDDRTGIPGDIFRGTLDNLEAEAATLSDAGKSRTLQKFDRRMCGGSSALIHTRPLQSLAAELRFLTSRTHDSDVTSGLAPSLITPSSDLARLWDLAVIADSDAIIPTANQLAAWNGLVPTTIIKGSHMPSFADLLHRLLIDKELVARRFAHSGATTYSTNATAQNLIAQKVASLIPVQNLKNKTEDYSCLELGAGSGLLTHLYAHVLPSGCDLTLCDISHISSDLPGHHVIADAETLIRDLPDASCDLILASSVMQWFNSPLRFLTHVVRTLRPGGIAILSTFAPDNFPQLRPYLSRPLLTPDTASYTRLLSSLPVLLSYSVTTEDITLTFDSPRQLLAHLKATGVNSLSANSTESARSARAILRAGITTLTYRPTFITLHRN